MNNRRLYILSIAGIFLYLLSWLLFFNSAMDMNPSHDNDYKFRLVAIIHALNLLLTITCFAYPKRKDNDKLAEKVVNFYKYFSTVYWLFIIGLILLLLSWDFTKGWC
jgi:uncharacterized membrane protein